MLLLVLFDVLFVLLLIGYGDNKIIFVSVD